MITRFLCWWKADLRCLKYTSFCSELRKLLGPSVQTSHVPVMIFAVFSEGRRRPPYTAKDTIASNLDAVQCERFVKNSHMSEVKYDGSDDQSCICRLCDFGMTSAVAFKGPAAKSMCWWSCHCSCDISTTALAIASAVKSLAQSLQACRNALACVFETSMWCWVPTELARADLEAMRRSIVQLASKRRCRQSCSEIRVQPQ